MPAAKSSGSCGPSACWGTPGRPFVATRPDRRSLGMVRESVDELVGVARVPRVAGTPLTARGP